MDGQGGKCVREIPMAERSWLRLPARFRTWIHDKLTVIDDQRKQIKELESRLGQNSTNSSRPPSTDVPWTAKSAKKQATKTRKPKSKRKPGGQPGHELHERPLVPPEEVDERQELRPEQCESCERHLPKRLPSVDEPRRHQIVEIPEITYSVSEYVQHGVVCPDCDTTTYARLPHGVSPSSFGPNLRAFIALLSGRYRTSRREVTELIHDVLGISISVGAVDNTCRRMSEALQAPVKEVAARVKEAPVVHMDETGWRQKGKRMWLWVVATSYAVLFHIGTRCKGEAIDLLGPDFQGNLVSDRYAVYYQFEADRRQVCWAHLSRDFQGVVDRGGAGCRIGSEALAIKNALFRIWHRYKAGEIQRSTMERQMRPVEEAFGMLLEKGQRSRGKRTAALCKSLSKLELALFLFARCDGVEPTNNAAEQALRPAVIWRKTCFGTQSERGSEFVARMMTATMTCRVQGRSLFQYLRSAVQARDHGDPAPSLLSEPPPENPVRAPKSSAA